jgi:hypothetical protein
VSGFDQVWLDDYRRRRDAAQAELDAVKRIGRKGVGNCEPVMSLRTDLAAKYRNVKTDGYASKKEAQRAAELKLMQQAGHITDLREQVRYELIPAQGSERACHYVADFVYFDAANNLIVEDTKGFRTPDYVIKRKLMKFVHGISITEV